MVPDFDSEKNQYSTSLDYKIVHTTANLFHGSQIVRVSVIQCNLCGVRR